MQPQFEILHDPAEGRSDAADRRSKWQSLEVGRIVPIYEAAGKGRLTARWFRRIIRRRSKIQPDIPDRDSRIVRGR